MIHERLLQRVKSVWARQTLDRRHSRAVLRDRQNEAGIYPLAVEQDRAGPHCPWSHPFLVPVRRSFFRNRSPLAQVAQVEHRSGINLVRFQSSLVNELGFNCDLEPFSDVRVPAGGRDVSQQEADRQRRDLRPGWPCRDDGVAVVTDQGPDVSPLPYDPVRAKALLAAAGTRTGSHSAFLHAAAQRFPTCNSLRR